MATLKIVNKNDWEILRKYICCDDNGAVILLPEENISNFPEEQAEKLKNSDDSFVDYYYGSIYLEVLETPEDDCAPEVIEMLESM